MRDVDELNRTLESIKIDVSNLIEKAFEEGFQKGLGVKLPTQRQCDNAHNEVSVYGEEGEWLVLGTQYSLTEAIEKFTEFLKRDDWGLADELMPSSDSVYYGTISYEMFEGEPSYVIRPRTGGRFNVWIFETQ